MENAGQFNWANRKRRLCSFESKITNTNQPFGLKRGNDLPQVLIARREESRFFRSRQFVRRTIATAAFDECQGTIVHDDVLGEKPVRKPESVCEEAP